MVCVCVFTLLSQLAFVLAHEDSWKTVTKHSCTFVAAAAAAAAAVAARCFVVAVQRRMKQLHPLCLSLSQCHCCSHTSSVSHMISSVRPRERKGECVCLHVMRVVCGSPLRWDHRSVNRVGIRHYFTWQPAKHGHHTLHTFLSCFVEFFIVLDVWLLHQ